MKKSIYLEMLTKYPETRTDYNEAFVRFNIMDGNLTEFEADVFRSLLLKCTNQKTVARRVRYTQKEHPEVNYTQEEAKKRHTQEQECREEYRSQNSFWNGIKRWFNN